MKNLITKYFKSPKGLYAMCIISLTESIFFIIPPDPFLALICIGKKFKKIFYPFFLCTIFSVIGGCIAYYLGDQIVNISKENNNLNHINTTDNFILIESLNAIQDGVKATQGSFSLTFD